MPNEGHFKIFRKGPQIWNDWRKSNPNLKPDLSDLNFEEIYPRESMYDLPEFTGFDLSCMNLNRISARNSIFTKCDFTKSSLHFSDLCFSNFDNCCFEQANLAVSKIGSAEFMLCNFTDADISYCSAEETKFCGSKLITTNLSNMSLVKTDFSNAIIDGATVYGISAWDLNLDGCEQRNIYISETATAITVPTIELAQFISLLINNTKIRDIIDTITSKVVLILGRFTVKRKEILDEIKDKLSEMDYVPILFDFDKSSSRDVTETVITLASMAKFVIADITSPKSIPQELTSIIPHFPSIAIQPIIEETHREYGMFEHFSKYPWVLETLKYNNLKISSLVEDVVQRCASYEL